MRFAVVASLFSKFASFFIDAVICDGERCLSNCTSSQLIYVLFIKIHVENNPYRASGRDSFLFSIASVFSEPSYIYIGLAGMIFVFDKSHVAHKGFHDFNPWVFMNKQGRQPIDVCGIDRQPRSYDLVNVKIHVRGYDVVNVKMHVRRYGIC